MTDRLNLADHTYCFAERRERKSKLLNVDEKPTLYIPSLCLVCVSSSLVEGFGFPYNTMKGCIPACKVNIVT